MASDKELICADPQGVISRYAKSTLPSSVSENRDPRWSSPDHDHDLLGYERYFHPVYPHPFSHFLSEFRQAHGRRSAVLDFMGWGRLFQGLLDEPGIYDDFQGGVTFSLGHPLDREEFAIPERKIIIAHARGNAVTESGWASLNLAMRSIGVSRAGLVVALPGGGWDWMPHDPALFSEIVRRLWELTAKDGMLLLEVPSWVRSGPKQLVGDVNARRPGYLNRQTPDPAALYASALRIFKSADWPQTLPELNFLNVEESAGICRI